MKTTQLKADTEAGDRKEASICKFDDASIRLSFIRKVSHTWTPSCPLQTSTNQLVTIPGVRPGFHSASHHLGFCCCIFTRRLQPKRHRIQMDLLGRLIFPGTYPVSLACMQQDSSKIPPHQPHLSRRIVHLSRMVHRYSVLHLLEYIIST